MQLRFITHSGKHFKHLLLLFYLSDTRIIHNALPTQNSQVQVEDNNTAVRYFSTKNMLYYFQRREELENSRNLSSTALGYLCWTEKYGTKCTLNTEILSEIKTDRFIFSSPCMLQEETHVKHFLLRNKWFVLLFQHLQK